MMMSYHLTPMLRTCSSCASWHSAQLLHHRCTHRSEHGCSWMAYLHRSCARMRQCTGRGGRGLCGERQCYWVVQHAPAVREAWRAGRGAEGGWLGGETRNVG